MRTESYLVGYVLGVQAHRIDPMKRASLVLDELDEETRTGYRAAMKMFGTDDIENAAFAHAWNVGFFQLGPVN